jgi:hypothetical protein
MTINTMITHADIRDLLTGYAAAIELDQIRVDALPREKFHRAYDDGMWRRCRRDHLDYLHRLLPTVNAIPLALLEELTRLAVTYEPPDVRKAIVDVLSTGAYEMCPPEEVETAAQFFEYVIKETCRWAAPRRSFGYTRSLMVKWLSITDPIFIAGDPECGYGQPVGFVS